MHGWLFMDTHFIDNDPPKTNSTSSNTKTFCLMNPGIYTILYFFINSSHFFETIDIDSLITILIFFIYFPNTMDMVLFQNPLLWIVEFLHC